MRAARLLAVKTLVDLAFLPSVKRKPVESMDTLSFLGRLENVVLLGPPVDGKSQLATTIAVAATESGLRVYCATLVDMITSLEESQQAGGHSRRRRTLVLPSLMVIDRLGYLPISRAGTHLLLELMSRGYEHASTVLISNEGFETWGEVLGDESMAAMLIDQLLHHSHIVNICGTSYWMRRHRELNRHVATATVSAAPPCCPPPPREPGRRPQPLHGLAAPQGYNFNRFKCAFQIDIDNGRSRAVIKPITCPDGLQHAQSRVWRLRVGTV